MTFREIFSFGVARHRTDNMIMKHVYYRKHVWLVFTEVSLASFLCRFTVHSRDALETHMTYSTVRHSYYRYTHQWVVVSPEIQHRASHVFTSQVHTDAFSLCTSRLLVGSSKLHSCCKNVSQFTVKRWDLKPLTRTVKHDLSSIATQK